MSVTAKGRRWEILHSLWIGWTFTLGFFNWVAFFYIGFRAKQRKWIYWGLFYSIPFVLAMVFGFGTGGEGVNQRWLGDLNVALTLVLGIISIFHAFKVRKEYLVRLEGVQHQARRSDSLLQQRLATEYQIDNQEGAPTQSRQLPDSSDISALNQRQEVLDKPPERTIHAPVRPTSQSQPSITEDKPERSTAPPITMDQSLPIIQSGDELHYRISSSYPFPIAFGFRSLMSIVDYRDLYRGQLRIAENILAFLASVSLTLLREQDRQEIDLKVYWRSGISPGDWKDIVRRCSKVFATYEDSPLALSISRLNIRLDQKGFGQDVAKLIQAKNDYKHDRGPTVLEDIAEACQEVQERLKRCMEKLSFFGDYPIRQVEDFNVSRSGDEFYLKCLRYMGDHPSFPQEEVVFYRGLPRGDLFLDLGAQNWVPLYPFIVTMTCLHCKAKETYFVDLWDPRRGTARMKSFERGHTMNNTDVSQALAEWRSQDNNPL